MKIEIVYRDLFEYSGQLFIKQMTSEYKYCLLDFGDIMRTNIGNETNLGKQIRAYIDRGELVPDQLTFDAVKEKIELAECENILLTNYPKNESQTKLFVTYCLSKDIEIKQAWYMKALNIMTNLEKVPKYSQMAAKYKSHEQIKLSSERIKMANEKAIEGIRKYCDITIFESESHGINYKEDEQRIKGTIHNNR